MNKIDIEIPEVLSSYAEEYIGEIIASKIYSLIESPKFMKYVGDKLLNQVKTIAVQQLTTVNTQEDIDASNYMNSMKVEINNDTIYLYNDSVIDTSTREISEEKRMNYPLQLSLAKIVEYGIGYTGSINATSYVSEDWQYDVNEHGYKGWYYKSNGQVFWTNGYEGRFVFLKMLNWIEENISSIIAEYLNENLKD